MAASKGSATKEEKIHAEFVACVVGQSRGPLEVFSRHQGIGKSCLCYRFFYPAVDEYVDDHQSILALHEFESYVVNNDHFLYWGSIVKHFPVKGQKSLHATIKVHVIEQTVFYQDETSLPFQKAERYIKRLLGPLDSPGKVSYKSRNDISLSSEAQQYPSKLSKMPRGFMVVLDVSLFGSEFDAHLQRTTELLDYLVKHKQKFIIVATKRDDSNHTSLSRAHELRKKYRTLLVETSASGNKNIREAFRLMASKVIKKPVELNDRITSFEEANHRSLMMRGHVKKAFQTYLQDEVMDPETDLHSLSDVPEYIECKKLTGMFDAGWLFATHIMEIYNDAYTTSGTTETQRDYLENFVKRRLDISSYMHHLKSWIDFHVEDDLTDGDDNTEEQEEEEEVSGDAESGTGHGAGPHPNHILLTIFQEDSPNAEGKADQGSLRGGDVPTAEKNAESARHRYKADVRENITLPLVTDNSRRHGNGRGTEGDRDHEYEMVDIDSAPKPIQGQSSSPSDNSPFIPESVDMRLALLLDGSHPQPHNDENYTKFHHKSKASPKKDTPGPIASLATGNHDTPLRPKSPHSTPLRPASPWFTPSFQISQPLAKANPEKESTGSHSKTSTHETVVLGLKSSGSRLSPDARSDRPDEDEHCVRKPASPTLTYEEVEPLDYENALSATFPSRNQHTTDHQRPTLTDTLQDGHTSSSYVNSQKVSADLSQVQSESNSRVYENNSISSAKRETEREGGQYYLRSPSVPKKTYLTREGNSGSNKPLPRDNIPRERTNFKRLATPRSLPKFGKHEHNSDGTTGRTDFNRLATPARHTRSSSGPVKMVDELPKNALISPFSTSSQILSTTNAPVTRDINVSGPDYVDEDYINTSLSSVTSRQPRAITPSRSAHAELASHQYVDEDYVNTTLTAQDSIDNSGYVNTSDSYSQSKEEDDFEYDYPDLRKARIPLPGRRAKKLAHLAKVHPKGGRSSGGAPMSTMSTELDKIRSKQGGGERESRQPLLHNVVDTEVNTGRNHRSIDLEDDDYINGYVNTECKRQLPSRQVDETTRSDKKDKGSEVDDFEYDYPDLQRNVFFKFGKERAGRLPLSALPPKTGNSNTTFNSSAIKRTSSSEGRETGSQFQIYANTPSWWLRMGRRKHAQVKEKGEYSGASAWDSSSGGAVLPPRNIARPTHHLHKQLSHSGSGLHRMGLSSDSADEYVDMSLASCTLDDCYINWETIYSCKEFLSSLRDHTPNIPPRKRSVPNIPPRKHSFDTHPNSTCSVDDNIVKTVDLSTPPEIPPRTRQPCAKAEESTSSVSESSSDRTGKSPSPPALPPKKPQLMPKPRSLSLNQGQTCSSNHKAPENKPPLRPKPKLKPKPNVTRHASSDAAIKTDNPPSVTNQSLSDSQSISNT